MKRSLLLLITILLPALAHAQLGSGSGSGGPPSYGDCRDECAPNQPCNACPLDACNQRQWCNASGTGGSYACQTVPMMCCKGDKSMVPNAQLRVGKRFKVSPESGIPLLEKWLGKGSMEVEAYLFYRMKENIDRDPNAQSCTSNVAASGATGFRACVLSQCFGVNFIAGGEAKECSDLECAWPDWKCNSSKFFRRLWGFFSAHVQRGVRFSKPTPIGKVDFSGWLMGGFTASGGKSEDSVQRASCGSNGCLQGGTTLESTSVAPWVGMKATGSMKLGWMGCETGAGVSLRACVEGAYGKSGTCTGSPETVSMKWKAALMLRGGDSPWSSGKICFTCGWVQGCWDLGSGQVLNAGSPQEPACFSALSVN